MDNGTGGPARRASMRDALTVIFRHQRLIVYSFLTVFGLVAFVTVTMDAVYESEAKIMIRIGRENVAVDPAVLGPTVRMTQDRESDINSEIIILESRYVAERAVATLGVDHILDPSKPLKPAVVEDPGDARRLRAVRLVMEGLSVGIEKRSNNIFLAFRCANALLAHDVLDALVTAFQERHIEVHQAQASLKFFQEKANSLLADIRGQEDRLAEFKRVHGVMDIIRQKDVLISQIDGLQRSLDGTLVQMEATRARIVAMEKALEGREPTTEVNRITGRTNYAADAIKERLIDLRIREADVLAKYPEGSTMRGQFLSPIRDGIRQTEAALQRETDTRTEVTTGIDTALQSQRANLDESWVELRTLVARRALFVPQLEERKATLTALTEADGQLQRLQSDLTFAWDEYRQCWDSLQRAKTSAALDSDRISNVVVVQPATHPMMPIKPNRSLNLALGFVFGLAGGIGLALLREFLDDTMKSERDVEGRLHLPVLASISIGEFDQCR